MNDVVVENSVLWTEVNRQIKQVEKNHNEQLRATTRPLVVLQHAEALLLPTLSKQAFRIGVAIQNIGPGLATDVEIRAWVRLTRETSGSEEERRAEIETLIASVDLDHPELTLRLGGIAGQSSPRFLPLTGETESDSQLAGRAILLYIAFYKDVFETKFPRLEKRPWRAGHVTIWQAGSWRMTQGQPTVLTVPPDSQPET